MTRLEHITWGTPRYTGVSRALALAGVDLRSTSSFNVAVYRNHIEYDEFQLDENGGLIETRGHSVLVKRRVVRNPNPRLAVTR